MVTTTCLSLAQVLQLVRCELGFTPTQIAARAFLRLEAYDALERGIGKPVAQELDRLMKFVPFLLPVLLDLPPKGPQAPMIQRLQRRLHTVELMAPGERAAELDRVRLELDWRDQVPGDGPPDLGDTAYAASVGACQQAEERATNPSSPVRSHAGPRAGRRWTPRSLRALWARAKSLLTST